MRELRLNARCAWSAAHWRNDSRRRSDDVEHSGASRHAADSNRCGPRREQHVHGRPGQLASPSSLRNSVEPQRPTLLIRRPITSPMVAQSLGSACRQSIRRPVRTFRSPPTCTVFIPSVSAATAETSRSIDRAHVSAAPKVYFVTPTVSARIAGAHQDSAFDANIPWPDDRRLESGGGNEPLDTPRRAPPLDSAAGRRGAGFGAVLTEPDHCAARRLRGAR